MRECGWLPTAQRGTPSDAEVIDPLPGLVEYQGRVTLPSWYLGPAVPLPLKQVRP